MWSCAEYIKALFLQEIFMYSKYEKTREENEKTRVKFESLVHYIQVLKENNVIILFIILVFQIWTKARKHKIYMSTIKNK